MTTAGGLNEATQARVQPGSAFKPFALAGALRDGIGLKSRYAGNSPLDIPGTDKQVNNEFDRDYGTSVDLVKATEQSINTAYVDLTLDMGARKVVDAAVDAGIPADTPGLEANAVNTLGTASVRNIDMSTAYATFAAKGKAATWYTVQEVKGANGGTRYEAHPNTSPGLRRGRRVRRELRAAAGREERHRHRGAVAGPAGGRARRAPPRSGRTPPPPPGSSATPRSCRQRSTSTRGPAGPTSTASAGCPTFFGGEYPARIWTAFMTAALQGKAVETFPPPAYVGETVNPQPTFDAVADQVDRDAERDTDGRRRRRCRRPRCRRRHRARRRHRRVSRHRPTPSSSRHHPPDRMTRHEIVAPSRDDTVVRLASEAVGGPLGRRARLGSSWWTPLRVLLALTFLTCGVGLVQKDWCRDHAWGAPGVYTHACYSDIPPLYYGRGLADGEVPYIGQSEDRQVEYPVLTGAVMWLTAQLVPSSDVPTDRSRWYFDINAIGLALAAAVAVGATMALAGRRPWDAAMFAPRAGARAGRDDQLGPVRRGAARPRHAGLGPGETGGRRRADRAGRGDQVLPAVRAGAAAGAVPAGRPDAGVLGHASWGRCAAWAAVNVPVMLADFDGWSKFYRLSQDRGAGFSSIWFVLSQQGHAVPDDALNVLAGGLFAVACLGDRGAGACRPSAGPGCRSWCSSSWRPSC